MPATITLLTDFGTRDSYVAQMKGVILSLAPGCPIVDISHEIPPQDIVAGARVLADAAMMFSPGTVHVAVVDPGVGTGRSVVAVELEGQRFVAPDNGLLSPLLDQYQVQRAVVVENRRLWRRQVSSTFHGRDIMAPVAAHLAVGGPLEEVGGPAAELTRFLAKPPQIDPAGATAEAIAIDHFGNVITNLPGDWLRQLRRESAGESVRLSVVAGSHRSEVIPVGTYAEASDGTLVALVGSHGRVELSVVKGSAARFLSAQAGMMLKFHVNSSH